MITGKIPDRLVYVYKPAVNGIHNTFVVNFDSYQEETALRWAGKEAKTFEVDNSVLTNVRLSRTSHRGENRKIFRVVIDAIYEVDLTEEALLDACNTRSGVISGKLPAMRWVIWNNKLKLAAVDGEIMKQIVAYQNISQLPKIPNNQLEQGRVYKDKYGSEEIYLGKVKIGKNNLFAVSSFINGQSSKWVSFRKSHPWIQVTEQKIENFQNILLEYFKFAIDESKKHTNTHYSKYYGYTSSEWETAKII